MSLQGDIRNIRKEKTWDTEQTRKFHSLPYNRIYLMLEHKLKLYGIRFVRQEESYSSQCSPLCHRRWEENMQSRASENRGAIQGWKAEL